MRLVFVLVVLVGSASFARSLPGTQASRLVLLAQAELKLSVPPPPQPLQGDPTMLLMQRFLDLEVRLLEYQRVSTAAPLAVTLVGGTGLVVALGFMAVSLSGSITFFFLGLVIAGVSAVPLLIGVPWLIAAASTNARIQRDIERVKMERAQVNASGPLPTMPLASF